MTIEEKARAYDEALERAQKATRAASDVAMDIVQYIFPQLTESEDERIMDCLRNIASLEQAEDVINDMGFTKEQILAWLKKQKEKPDYLSTDRVTVRPDGGVERHTIGYLEKREEQKPVPKFKVGETIKYRGETYEITEIEATDNGPYYSIRLIGDPSDWDEVKTGIGPGGEKDMVKVEQKPLGDKYEFALSLRNCLKCGSELTEEQSDIFTDGYAEDLYKVAVGELDPGIDKQDLEDYKNEIKRPTTKSVIEGVKGINYPIGNRTVDLPSKEQNPAEWSDEDNIHLTNAILSAEREWGKDSYTAKWLNELPNRFILQSNKQEWSEDMLKAFDETLFTFINNAYNIGKDNKYVPDLRTGLRNQTLTLLATLNNQYSKSQEWSEEDEEMLERLDDLLWILDSYIGDDCSLGQEETDSIRSEIQNVLSPFVKSLRPQPKRDCKDCAMFLNGKCTKPRWKPSEEQIEELNKARRFIPYNCDILAELYEQLKAL